MELDPNEDSSPPSQREVGEGWDREQAKRLEERNKWFEEGVLSPSEMGTRWDSMELKAGSVPVPVFDTVDAEVSRKWAQFENLPFRDMSAQSLIGAEACLSGTSHASQTVVDSQMFRSSPEEAKPPVTAAETDMLRSAPPSPATIEARATKMNTTEVLQREVRRNMQHTFNKKNPKM